MPDQVGLTKVQAERLSGLTDVAADRLVGRTMVELAKAYPFVIDPSLFLFRRICGRVVRTDPVTGNLWGVPGATVHVWDTDVNLFASFPTAWPYGWFFPWGWRQEEIGSAQTDACGNFCVWIPQFDVDWVLQWRRERRCFFDVLRRVSIRDLIERLHPIVEVPPHVGPWPGPDPGPLAFLDAGVGSRQILDQAVGPAIGAKLGAAANARFGEAFMADGLLDAPAFPRSMPHPDAPMLRDLVADHLGALPKSERAAFEKIQVDPHAFAAAWIGPYLRCLDVFVPEFERILDVPDISLSVTQDVNGDGTPETIYSEGLFDVRWNAGTIPPVTLHAQPFAFATPSCGDTTEIACAAPELVLVGHMPLKNAVGPGVYPIVDTATGYAVRPNRPHPSGRTNESVGAGTLASAPLTGLLEFRGCAHHAANGVNASHYRIQHRVSTNGGATFGPWQPIFDHWQDWRVFGPNNDLQVRAISTTDGWYPVLTVPDGWMLGDHYLLQWHGPPDGMIEMQLELGTAAGAMISMIGQAPVVRIVVDNALPQAAVTSLAWRVTGSGPWTPLSLNCPTIRRNHQDIEIKVGVSASGTHLQSFTVSAGGCGASGGNPTLRVGLENLEMGVPPGDVVSGYWHKSATDNNHTDEVVYGVPASSASGAYSVGVASWSRAFYPGDGHVYDLNSPDLGYLPAPNWRPASIAIAIVD